MERLQQVAVADLVRFLPSRANGTGQQSRRNKMAWAGPKARRLPPPDVRRDREETEGAASA